MSIFSRVKKAKKAAQNHKAATVQAEEVKPSPAPYKHIPTHASLDALASSPTTWSPEESKARIAAARKRRNEMASSAPVVAPHPTQRSYAHSHAESELNLSTHPAYRPRRDLSIDSVIQQPHTYMHSPKLSSQSSLSTLPYDSNRSQSPNEVQTFAQPREAPVPPQKQRSYRSSHAPSSSSSILRRKSPLSTVSTEEETDDESSHKSTHSSKNSTYSATSLSHTSSIESQPRRSGSSEGMSKLPRLPMPKFLSRKRQNPIEISLPYESNNEYSTPSSSIPTWRYEDFIAYTQPPTIVRTLSSTHSKRSSTALSILHQRDNSLLAH